ncbi:MAG: septum formation initiator family protein [Bacteroidota bacterium]|nr:septum formation initiator family protein [Bacteroidota bacterium]
MIPILRKIAGFFRNKFLLTIAIFLVWIFLFDSNNLLDRIKDIRNLNQLKSDREYYIEKTTQDSLRLKELKTDNANLEKYAREQYLMKRDNEDIFVVVRKE